MENEEKKKIVDITYVNHGLNYAVGYIGLKGELENDEQIYHMYNFICHLCDWKAYIKDMKKDYKLNGLKHFDAYWNDGRPDIKYNEEQHKKFLSGEIKIEFPIEEE